MDALAAGADWWALGGVLGQHPQAAFDRYAHLDGDTSTRQPAADLDPLLVEELVREPVQPPLPQRIRPPAEQRPHLAALITAGLAGVHQPCPEYGVDLDPTPIAEQPKVEQLHAAARLCGHRLWTRITLPGRHPGSPLIVQDMLNQWTTVLCDDAELAQLSQALAL